MVDNGNIHSNNERRNNRIFFQQKEMFAFNKKREPENQACFGLFKSAQVLQGKGK